MNSNLSAFDPKPALREAAHVSWRFIAAVMLPLALSACMSYGPGRLAVGQTASQVQQELGAPTARHALQGGATRLEFARGPFGQHTFMVDIDSAGRVARWEQVLTELNFEKVQPGLSAQDLLLQLGMPSHRRSGGRQGGEVWSYRYQATFCQWFQVDVVDGRVRTTAYGPDPACDVNDDRT